jgi:hypothetical protein
MRRSCGAEKGVNLQVRVGVNTGEVVVRSIKTGDAHTEYAPIGHSTSLASRLQTLANPGSIAISEAARKLIEGYFALKPLGPARIKGVSEPVNVYEVTGLGPLRTRLQRSAGRGLTKFVGREREMEALKHAAEQAKSGHGQRALLRRLGFRSGTRRREWFGDGDRPARETARGYEIRLDTECRSTFYLISTPCAVRMSQSPLFLNHFDLSNLC